MLRVLPYSAAQLCGYDLFKKAFTPADGELTVQNKLAAGACAGMLSTLVCPATPAAGDQQNRIRRLCCFEYADDVSMIPSVYHPRQRVEPAGHLPSRHSEAEAGSRPRSEEHTSSGDNNHSGGGTKGDVPGYRPCNAGYSALHGDGVCHI